MHEEEWQEIRRHGRRGNEEVWRKCDVYVWQRSTKQVASKQVARNATKRRLKSVNAINSPRRDNCDSTGLAHEVEVTSKSAITNSLILSKKITSVSFDDFSHDM